MPPHSVLDPTGYSGRGGLWDRGLCTRCDDVGRDRSVGSACKEPLPGIVDFIRAAIRVRRAWNSLSESFPLAWSLRKSSISVPAAAGASELSTFLRTIKMTTVATKIAPITSRTSVMSRALSDCASMLNVGSRAGRAVPAVSEVIGRDHLVNRLEQVRDDP